MPVPQNGQTHPNNLLVKADELFLSVFDHFVRLELKRLTTVNAEIDKMDSQYSELLFSFSLINKNNVSYLILQY